MRRHRTVNDGGKTGVGRELDHESDSEAGADRLDSCRRARGLCTCTPVQGCLGYKNTGAPTSVGVCFLKLVPEG